MENKIKLLRKELEQLIREGQPLSSPAVVKKALELESKIYNI